MSTRAVLYIHTKDEKQCNVDYTMKLYHHWDGYIEGGLGEQLVDMITKVAGEKNGGNNGSCRELFDGLCEVGGFEPTCYNHGDTEYIYHLTYDIDWKGNEGMKFEYKLEVQKGEDLGSTEDYNTHKTYTMCCDWEGEKVERKRGKIY